MPRANVAGVPPWMIRALCLALLLVLARGAFAQNFDFRAPASVTDASVPAAMRDLAVRVLPVYQEDDPERYLTNLSALQLVAGNYDSAYASRQSLRDRRKNADAGRPVNRSVIYDIYARAKALEASNKMTFAQAFSQAFRETAPKLNDLDAYTLDGWFGAPVSSFKDALQQAFDQRRAKGSLTLAEAVDLIRTYMTFEAHRSSRPLVDSLIAVDDGKRYEIDWDVLIKTPDGGSISAVVVLPKSTVDPLPALLEFTIHVDTQNYAKECAAHGYVGIVAFSRGERRSRGGIIPYQHDGDDVRAVINWIAKQSWSNGRVGMYGTGYSGFTPWAAAKRLPPALKAIATSDTTAPGIDFPMVGNIWRNSSYRWVSCVTRAEGFDEKVCNDDTQWRAWNQVWYTSGKRYRDLDRLIGQRSPIFQGWLNHPSYDRYWQKMIPDPKQLARINIPVLTTTGYYAGGEIGALYYFLQHHRHNPRANHTLLIGPYDDSALHRGPQAVLQNYQIDSAALIDLRELRYQWFDHVLKGAAAPPLLNDRIVYEVMGANQWRHAASLEAMGGKGSLKLYLDPAQGDRHRLVRREPQKPAFLQQTLNLADRADASWMPLSDIVSKTLATHNSVTYVSEPMSQPMEIGGLVSGRLDFTLNKMDMDLSVALYEQLPSGDYVRLYDPAYEFRASYAHDHTNRRLLKAGERQQLSFKSERVTSRRLQAGSRVVLVLSLNKRPDQEINYGTGGAVADETLEEGKVPLKVRWYSGSFIDIPFKR